MFARELHRIGDVLRWAGRKSANQLTVAAQDPISKIPQYKVCGCRVRKAAAAPEYAAVLEPQQ